MLLVREPVLLGDLAVALLAEEKRETFAESGAAAFEAAPRHRFVELYCILVWDAYWDLNCHALRVWA